MSNYISTTFGRIIGKHGTAVGAIREGKPVLRVFTPPANPKTAKQIAQRTKFAFVWKALKPLRRLFYIGFGSKKGYYEAISWVLKNAITGVSPNFTIDFSKVKIASGSLSKARSSQITAAAGNVVTVEWDSVLWGEGSLDDLAHVVYVDPLAGAYLHFATNAKRQDGEFTTTLTGVPAGITLHVWLFFAFEDQRSDSQYAGTVLTV